MTTKEKAKEIIKRLSIIYPNPKTALLHSTPFQLLVATILSAQATDKLVNKITPELFKQYKTPEDFANASISEIDNEIKRVNFHNNKAKNIHATAKMIVTKYHGILPETMEELDSLPGVARKTANVVLGSAFGKTEGIVVDTHVMRLSQKLGLTKQKTPEKIEQDLMKIIPKEKWIEFSHLLILHGRDICTARAHTCHDCPLKELCPEYKNSNSLS